jgi:hypothetical protein
LRFRDVCLRSNAPGSHSVLSFLHHTGSRGSDGRGIRGGRLAGVGPADRRLDAVVLEPGGVGVELPLPRPRKVLGWRRRPRARRGSR